MALNQEPELFLGKYTKEIREHFMLYRVARYLIDHPGSTNAMARKSARVAWRLKAKRSMGYGTHRGANKKVAL